MRASQASVPCAWPTCPLSETAVSVKVADRGVPLKAERPSHVSAGLGRTWRRPHRCGGPRTAPPGVPVTQPGLPCSRVLTVACRGEREAQGRDGRPRTQSCAESKTHRRASRTRRSVVRLPGTPHARPQGATQSHSPRGAMSEKQTNEQVTSRSGRSREEKRPGRGRGGCWEPAPSPPQPERGAPGWRTAVPRMPRRTRCPCVASRCPVVAGWPLSLGQRAEEGASSGGPQGLGASPPHLHSPGALTAAGQLTSAEGRGRLGRLPGGTQRKGQGPAEF